ncbi:MAG: glyoxalase/bleomycin resistance/extradiol dioxygenase family protein [Bacteroidia bacterium]|nr:glyoxalase/bleomycin resistance/extradiol dioxygenase family protein [Bacteroidia bacterium]MBP7713318.1 glyoxalase/bleomycin resistance/extradiol dioxygenase family protein [Bacteroidia bacterium]MBP8669465.1 glyoxalase/bleomycin resistance/extradiol dioxygenase family protein [Bacteroidia bacterium]HOZ81598.1 glyoxalase/bleomycin resistance/extradiol dioxygenase family protein [Bacteroidia bacterium]HOZ89414.1 glyoxalase/bleomycin resistance/extradiol dioxygenase family protein [Bacteroidi
MSKQVFINLPVKDLKRSMSFYEAIGFTNNPQFTDHTAACMVWSDTIFVMLLTHDKFKQFTSKLIIDAKQSVGVSNALFFESIDAMKSFAENAVKAGGREYAAASDYGFMQQHFIEDLDGHNWEPFYMDMSKFPG